MKKVSFLTEDMVADFTASLREIGYIAVSEPELLSDKSFCVIGNDVYFFIML